MSEHSSGHSSGLRDLPDLARDVRERVVIPPYDEVSRRVRARRLRGAAGSVAAAVLVVGGVAVWQNVATTAGPPVPQPAERTPIPPTDESQWRAVVYGTDAHVFALSGTDDGAVAVVWRALEQPEPTFAMVIREADGSVHGTRLDDPVDLTPVPGGWVGLSTVSTHIGTDGGWSDLGAPGGEREIRPGDVMVRGPYGRWLYSPADSTLSSVPVGYPEGDAYVTPDGDFVGCESSRSPSPASVSVRRNQHEVGLFVDAGGCVVEGHGDHVVVAVVGNAPDGSVPLRALLVSDDGGDTWKHPDSAVVDLASLAVLDDGTWVTTGTDGTLDVHAAGGHQRTLEGHGVATVAGDSLYTLGYADATGPLSFSDDGGETWHETPPPGMESSAD